MKTVILVRNALEPDESRSTHAVQDVSAFLATLWPRLPDGVVIYHGSLDNNVTPSDEAGVERLQALRGTFLVYEYPEDPVTAALVIGAVLVGAYVASQMAAKPPAIPSAARNIQAASPNNELSARTNVARPNGRIPDIFGEQISTPDLVAAPYSIYEDHREKEYAYMCASRGALEVEEEDIKDGETRVLDIAEASVHVYGPNTSPNSGTAQISIGSIDEGVLYSKKNSSVNGQVLLPPTTGSGYVFDGTWRFYSTNGVASDAGIDLIAIFGSSAVLVDLQADSFVDDLGGPLLNLSGRYKAVFGTNSVAFYHPDQTPGVGVFGEPERVNEDWTRSEAAYPGTGGDNSPFMNCFISTVDTSDNWIGPFVLDSPDLTSVIANFVAPQGMYRDDGTEQTSTTVAGQLEITRVNLVDVATSTPEVINFTIVGSATLRNQRATTVRPTSSPRGRVKVRARRLTRRDESYDGQVTDEIRWKDLYGTYEVTKEHFGDVTTVHTKTIATDGALSIKERKLNLRCVRKVRLVSATPTTYTLSSELLPSKRMLDIFVHAALDPFIGNRKPKDLNFYELLQAQLACETRFGTPRAAEFCYTFDKGNISFEETADTIAEATFNIAYRRGHVITMAFEGPQATAKLSFGHRNKLPGTEKRTYSFGNDGDFDGVEYNYMDEDGQAPQTIYVPADRSAVNPKPVESVGVRNALQAYFHANRIYNKLRKQRVAVEFEATQEAALLVRNDPILVADNTRPSTQDGEITEKSGLVLTTSQPVTFLPGSDYTVFLQLTDGTVQAITATPGATRYQITLSDEPLLELSLNPANFTLATYILVADDDTRIRQFMVRERLSAKNFTHTVKAINYDPGYYANDQDYTDHEIDEELTPPAPTIGAEWSGLTLQFQDSGEVWSVYPGVFGFPIRPWYSGAPITGIGGDYYIRLERLNGTPNYGAEVTVDGIGGTGVLDTDWQAFSTFGPWVASAPLDGGTLPYGYARYEVFLATDDTGTGEVKIGEAAFVNPEP